MLVAYGHDGEALPSEQGYSLRLVVLGREGNVNVNVTWLGCLHVKLRLNSLFLGRLTTPGRTRTAAAPAACGTR